MKTSNKLLLAVLLIISAYCVASAFALKTEYLKGDYKSRFYRMTNFNLSDFDAVYADIPNTAITIEQGDKFAVWVTSDLHDIEVARKNNTLTLNYKSTTRPTYGYGSSVVIICPRLVSLTLGTKLPREQKLAIQQDFITNKIDGAFNTISGFKQDTMAVEVNNATHLNLGKSAIQSFNAVVNWGGLSVSRDNKLNIANFDIKNYCEFDLDHADIKKPTYKLSNTAKIIVTGEAVPLLNKQ
jgi:hypothetical protein